MSGVFFVLALLRYLPTLNPTLNRKKGEREGGIALTSVLSTVGLAFLAMISKEQGITVVGVCIGMEVMGAIGHTIRGKSHTKEGVSHSSTVDVPSGRGRRLMRLAIIAILTAIILYTRLVVLGSGSKGEQFQKHDNPIAFAQEFSTRFLSHGFIYAYNVCLLLWPFRLSCDYTHGTIPLVETVKDTRNIATLALVGSLLAGLLALFLSQLGGTRKSNKEKIDDEIFDRAACRDQIQRSHDSLDRIEAGNHRERGACRLDGGIVASQHTWEAGWLGLLLLVVPFLPAMNILFTVGFVVAERVLYTPSMGACVLEALLFQKIAQRLHKDNKLNRRVLQAIVLLVLVSFAAKTTARCVSLTWYTIYWITVRVGQSFLLLLRRRIRHACPLPSLCSVLQESRLGHSGDFVSLGCPCNSPELSYP